MVRRALLKTVLVGDLSLKRVVRSILLITLLVYLGLFVYVSIFADRIIFQPPPSSYTDGPEIVKLRMPDGSVISAAYLTNPTAKFTILYSHGNAEDIGSLLPMLEEIRTLGFNVLAYDYRGYGTSTGRSTEATAYQDEDAAYDFLVNEKKTPAGRIIVLGRSLGGAVAVDLASRRPVAGLILESTFVSAYRVLTRIPLFPFDRFRSLEKLSRVRCPVLVIHGRRDEIIGFWHGERLFQDANEPKLSFWIDNAGHNDLFDTAGSRYGEGLRNFTKLIDRTGSPLQ
jgi:fermentation-respiration switch protein FrsA (DUF1100 family)